MITSASAQSIEEILGSARGFGDSDYIKQQQQNAYMRRLGLISPTLPSAGRLIDALGTANVMARDMVLGNTVVRCSVQHALTKIETGADCALSLNECADVFDAAAGHLNQGICVDPLQVGLPEVHHLDSRMEYGLIWSEDHDDDMFGRAFRKLIVENYGSPLCVPTADQLAVLRRGTSLLTKLVPTLAKSALSHARVIGVFPGAGSWNGRASSSQFRISATIFLHRDLLVSPWWVAEHLLHESLHQKLYDFRHGHSLLSPDYQRADAPGVCALWNIYDVDRSNYWDVHRVLAAFHVYTHLALLASRSEERHEELECEFGRYNYPISTTSSQTALLRARYLGEQLKSTCRAELGPAGQAMTNWLISILDALDSAPPPSAATLHLTIGLYRREISLLQAVLDRLTSYSGTDYGAFACDREALSTLADDDLKTSTSILRAAGAASAADALEREWAAIARDELAVSYPLIRERIASEVLAASDGGYTLRSAGFAGVPLDENVRQMVEHSSRRLDMIIRGRGDEVAVMPETGAAAGTR